MRVILLIVSLLFTLSISAQDRNKLVINSTSLEINQRGEHIKKTAETVNTVTIDLAAQTFTINSDDKTIKELMRNKMTRKITKQMGDISKSQFSLELEDKTFVHFFLEKDKIIMTRSDIHPLKWGIQFRDIEVIEE